MILGPLLSPSITSASKFRIFDDFDDPLVVVAPEFVFVVPVPDDEVLEVVPDLLFVAALSAPVDIKGQNKITIEISPKRLLTEKLVINASPSAALFSQRLRFDPSHLSAQPLSSSH